MSCRMHPVVLSALLMLLCSTALPLRGAAMTDPARTYVTGKTSLTIDGIFCGWVKSAAGGDAVGQVVQEPLGADRLIRKHLAGVKYRAITLQIGLTLDRSVYQWIGDAWAMKAAGKTGVLTTADYNYTAQSALKFTNALITEVTIPACGGAVKDPGYLTMSIAPEVTREEAPAPTGKTGTTLEKAWLPANFRLEIDGLDCSRVSKIDPITVRTRLAQNAVGELKDFQQAPAGLDISNLKIWLPEAGAASWKAWHDDFVIKGNNRQDKERNGRLIFLAADMQTELLRVNLYNLGIFSYAREGGAGTDDTIQRMVAELYCERIELDAGKAGTVGTAPPAEEAVQPPAGKGVFGTTYRLRQRDPFYFTMKSANYAVHPVSVGDRTFTAAGGEKMLVLHYTIQNPNTTERLVRSDSLRFSVIDDTGVNVPALSPWGVETSGQPVSFVLQPKQTVALFTVVTLRARGEPGTILVRSNQDNDGPELPYDVHGNVAALPAPFADPRDASGASALEEIRASAGTAYPCDNFAHTLEKMAWATANLGELRLAEGERFLVCTVLMKNHTSGERLLRGDTLRPRLLSDANEELSYRAMYFATADRPVSQAISAGDVQRIRLLFVVPKGVNPKELVIQENKSRRYRYQVTF